MRWLIAWLALATADAAGQSVEPTPTIIQIRPASAPVPALKYRFLPDRSELVPGNAAVFYHRAILTLTSNRRNASEQNRADGKPKPNEDPVVRWLGGPIGAIPLDAAKAHLELHRRALKEAELGSLRATCDWEFDSRDDGFDLFLPEIQEMREVGRLAALSARVAVLAGEFDAALHWIQVGSAMARHTSQGPTLIQALVGVSMQGQLIRPIEDLIQSPGAPSYAWALARRPRPVIDLARPLEGERAQIGRAIPEFGQLDVGPMSVDEAKRLGDGIRRKLGQLSRSPSLAWTWAEPAAADAGPPPLDGFAARLAFASMVASAYPDARRSLVAGGRPAAVVEAMPAMQAVGIATLRDFERIRDDVDRWSALPYWQGVGPADRASREATERAKAGGPLLAALVSLLPTTRGAQLAALRLERQLDALQCIEAIRLYAGAHGGALPPDLASIAEAPVPIDPATGRPFQYEAAGTTATLRGPLPEGAPKHPSYLIRYELKSAP